MSCPDMLASNEPVNLPKKFRFQRSRTKKVLFLPAWVFPSSSNKDAKYEVMATRFVPRLTSPST